MNKAIKIKNDLIENKNLEKSEFKIEFYNDKIEKLIKLEKHLLNLKETNSKLYYKNIDEQLTYEKKILELINNKKDMFSQELFESYIKRLNRRIKILETKEDVELNVKDIKIEVNEKIDKITENVKNEVKEDPKKKVQGSKNEVLDLLKDRLDQYNRAYRYIIKNEFSSTQAEKAREFCIKINKMIEDIENNVAKYKEFDVPIIPSSELIVGLDKTEREKRFKIIIEDFNKRKLIENNKLVKFKESINSMSDAVKKRNKESIDKTINDLNGKVEKFTKILSSLNTLLANAYAPVPITVEDIENIQFEKINDDVPENNINITIYNTEPFCKANFIIGYEFNEKENMQFTFSSKLGSSPILVKNIPIAKSDFKGILKKSFIVEITKLSCCSKELIGTATIPMDYFKSESTKILDIMIIPEIGIPKYSLKVQTKIRASIIDKEYRYESKTILRISKIFQPFKLILDSEEEDEDDNKASQIKEKIKVEDLIPEKKQSNVNQDKSKINKTNTIEKPKPVKDNNNKPNDSDKFVPYPKEVSEPDCLDFITSIKVLDYMTLELEKKRNSCEGRCPDDLRKKIQTTKVKKNTIENWLSDGTIEEAKKYLRLMEARLLRDIGLSNYFKENNNEDKYKIVASRIPILKADINEAIECIKNNQ